MRKYFRAFLCNILFVGWVSFFSVAKKRNPTIQGESGYVIVLRLIS